MLTATRKRMIKSANAGSNPCEELLDSILGSSSTPTPSRQLDICKLAQQYVARPAFAGSYSIKKVLPAAIESLTGRDLLDRLMPELSRPSQWGHSPYDSLAEHSGMESSIANGTAATDAFNQLRQNPPSDDKPNSAEHGLRLYCRLDTATMAVAQFSRRSAQTADD